MDCSPPGSSVHGISQARILEQMAISSSKGSSWPRDQTPSLQADSLPLSHEGSPNPSILELNIWLAKKFIPVFHKMLWKTEMNFLVNPIHRYLTQLGPLKLYSNFVDLFVVSDFWSQASLEIWHYLWTLCLENCMCSTCPTDVQTCKQPKNSSWMMQISGWEGRASWIPGEISLIWPKHLTYQGRNETQRGSVTKVIQRMGGGTIPSGSGTSY